MSKTLFAAAAALALLAGQAVAAEVQTDQVQTTVLRTGHVDYSNQAEVQKLAQHINAVARRVCSDASPDRIYAPATPDAECVRSVESQAVSKINRPLLTAAFEGDRSPSASHSALAGNDQ